MYIVKTHLIILSWLFLGALQAQAQTAPDAARNSLYAIGKYQPNRVILRWAPSSAAVWEQTNQTGFFVERLAIPEKAEDLRNRRFERLQDRPFMPSPAAAWEGPAAGDDAVATAYMTLYGQEPVPASPDMLSRLQQQSSLQENRYFMAMSAAQLSAKAADLLGLRFEDLTAKAGERYLYKIYPAARLPELAADTAFVYLTAEAQGLSAPAGLETVAGEKIIYARWDISVNKADFYAYYLERSENPRGPFKRLHQAPLIYLKNPELPDEADDMFSFKDSVGVNYKPYYYRLIGIDHFAEPSPPSTVVMGMARDFTPPLPPNILKAEARGQTAHIQWEKPIREGDFAGYIVSRSTHPEEVSYPLHDALLPPGAREFTDPSPVLNGRNFYMVTAVDTAGNMASSFAQYVLFENITPPATPTGLRGVIDTAGNVRLQWSPNTEDGLMGYRVYWANDPTHRFIMISSEMITDTTFAHAVTVNTLSKYVYFRIAAVNNGFGHSELSEILELQRPDVIPPAPAVFDRYQLRGDGVELYWLSSSSDDVAQQQLLRRKPGEPWRVHRTLEPSVRMFFDELPEGGTLEYALRIVDEAGLFSEVSAPVGVSIDSRKVLAAVENLSAAHHPERGVLEIRWEYPAAANTRFILYRAVNDSGWMSYQSIPGGTTSFLETSPQPGRYAYAIRVVDDAAGRESELRTTPEVQINQ